MTYTSKILAGTAAAAAMTLSMASAAQAQSYPYDNRYYERDRPVSIGEIVAGVGAVAGAVGAVTRGGAYGGVPYGYPQSYGYGYPQGNAYGYGYARPPAYGYGYQQVPAYGYGYGNAYGGNAAVSSCAAEAQRFARGGQVRITDVDAVSRGRIRVRGTYDEVRPSYYGRVNVDREGFSCLAYGNGQIQDFDN